MNLSPLLVDADVVSFLAKDHPIGTWYQEALDGRSLAISIVTIGEIEYGMESRGWSVTRRGQMRRLMDRFTSIPADGETARLWAQVRIECERKGRPIGFADAWIAATALQLNIPLVSHNAKDYESIDALTIITASN